MIFLQGLKSFFLVFILTVLTQTGGVIYLLYKPISIYLHRIFPKNKKRVSLKLLVFTLLYFAINLFITPSLARKSGRVPLPMFVSDQSNLATTKWYTVLMNRHYVTPELYQVTKDVARQLDDGNTILYYLDANFPFIDGFPLIPHLSHDDGEKLDLAFFYKNGNRKLKGNPGLLGYGFCEGPRQNEVNTVKKCLVAGHWQYDILSKLNVGFGSKKYQFDEARTKLMIQAFSKHPKIKKIFLEPHLKSRMDLSGDSKIRFHGCHSVRHDDHLHVQL